MERLTGMMKDNYLSLSDLSIPDRNKFWSAMRHLALEAGEHPDGRDADLLRHVEFRRCPADTLALWRAILSADEDAVALLDKAQMAALMKAEPCDPVVQVAVNPTGLRRYAQWGIRA